MNRQAKLLHSHTELSDVRSLFYSQKSQNLQLLFRPMVTVWSIKITWVKYTYSVNVIINELVHFFETQTIHRHTYVIIFKHCSLQNKFPKHSFPKSKLNAVVNYMGYKLL